ncbi:hypothetical protein TWF506_005101 [Arthrobotrys conoides]|uniref:Uncharacterized protein n=1 Tax=Arthrobotrys conoides TaxID=74498 RepID=A0AAN8NIP6_9PEZI
MRFHVPLSTCILGTLVLLTTAYEVAFYPGALNGLDSAEADELVFHVYPRFQCNKAILNNPNENTENVVVRVSEDSIAPGVIVFFDASENDPDPCKGENGIVAGYFFKDRKPSQQVLYADTMRQISHFMELTEDSDLYAYLVDWLELKPGRPAFNYKYLKKKDGAADDDSPPPWQVMDWMDPRVFPYDHDFAYNTEEDLSLGINSDGELRPAAEGVIWPEMNSDHGSDLAPSQKVPENRVYRKKFRDWRNARYRYGDYRPIAKNFPSDIFTINDLKDMGYIIDEAKEMQIQHQRQEDKRKALNLERGYEEDRYNQLRAQEKYTGVSELYKQYDFGSNVYPPEPYKFDRYQRRLQQDVANPGISGFGGAPGGNDMYVDTEYLQQEGVEIEEDQDQDVNDEFAQRYGGPGQLGYEADNEYGTNTEYLSTTQFLSSIQGAESQGVPPRSPLYEYD